MQKVISRREFANAGDADEVYAAFDYDETCGKHPVSIYKPGDMDGAIILTRDEARDLAETILAELGD